MLLVQTPNRWLERALASPDLLLLDVAHCEKKAAGTVLGLVFKDLPRAAAYSRLAREELGHFEQALALLAARGRTFEPLIPAKYASALARLAAGDLCASLTVAAIIEARSAERLDLLQSNVQEPDLARLYAALHPPEERHVALLLQFAEAVGDVAAVLPRLLEAEAALIIAGEDHVRMHS
jgi:tRNA-(ms[2]io[6]A)-hydroxylase